MSRSIIIAGAGFRGMSLAAHLRRLGFDIELYEKCESTEGPGQRLVQNEFRFDRKSEISLLPEVIERFFHQFNHPASDFLSYTNPKPAIRFFFSPAEFYDLQGNIESNTELFRRIEKNGDRKYLSYLRRAKAERDEFIDTLHSSEYLELNDIVPSISWLPRRGHQSYVRSLFQDYRSRAILQFPDSFLNLVPRVSQQQLFILNYNLHTQGIFYPLGGLGKLYDGMFSILNELNIPVNYGSVVSNFDIIDNTVCGVLTNQKSLHADIYVSATNYFSTEHMLTNEYRNVASNSSAGGDEQIGTIHFLLGINTVLKNLKHHNLVFDDDFRRAGKMSTSGGYVNMMYIKCPSKSEKGLAPKGMESVEICMQVPPGVEDTGKMREHYFTICLRRLEELTGQSLEDKVVVKKTSTSGNRIENAEKLGKNSHRVRKHPGIRNKHLANLYYADISAVAGSAISSSILSGEAVAAAIHADIIRHSQ